MPPPHPHTAHHPLYLPSICFYNSACIQQLPVHMHFLSGKYFSSSLSHSKCQILFFRLRDYTTSKEQGLSQDQSLRVCWTGPASPVQRVHEACSHLFSWKLLWTDLPEELRAAKRVSSFKLLCKTSLFMDHCLCSFHIFFLLNLIFRLGSSVNVPGLPSMNCSVSDDLLHLQSDSYFRPKVQKLIYTKCTKYKYSNLEGN